MIKKPKVLFYDIETSPVLAWIWRTGPKVYIGHDQIRRHSKFDIICICYKWQGEREIHSLDWGVNEQDSSDMIEKFTKIIESADLVIGHNSDNFDQKQLNTQRLMHDQDPIAWPTSEDTLKQFRKYFAFPNYKLDYLAKTLVGRGKGDMCFQDWINVVEGKSRKALEKMIDYCKKDVRRLEQIFIRASKHFAPKVNMGIIVRKDAKACPRCGSSHVVNYGTRVTMAGRYQRFRCEDCAHRIQGRTRI